jgi:hypothetical protein
LGEPSQQQQWLNAANNTASLIQSSFWDKQRGVYFDRITTKTRTTTTTTTNEIKMKTKLPGNDEETYNERKQTQTQIKPQVQTQTQTQTKKQTQYSFVDVVTPATFWPAFVGISETQQVNSIITNVFLNQKELKTEFPMPCVGVSEPTFNPNNYWRGKKQFTLIINK